MVQAIEEGLAERKIDKDARGEEDDRDEFDRLGEFGFEDIDEDDEEGARRKAQDKLPKVKKLDETEDRMAESKRPRRGLAKPRK